MAVRCRWIERLRPCRPVTPCSCSRLRRSLSWSCRSVGRLRGCAQRGVRPLSRAVLRARAGDGSLGTRPGCVGGRPGGWLAEPGDRWRTRPRGRGLGFSVLLFWIWMLWAGVDVWRQPRLVRFEEPTAALLSECESKDDVLLVDGHLHRAHPACLERCAPLLDDRGGRHERRRDGHPARGGGGGQPARWRVTTDSFAAAGHRGCVRARLR